MPTQRGGVFVYFLVGAISVLISGLLFFVAVSSPTTAQSTGFVCLVFAEILVTLVLVFIERHASFWSGTMFRAGSFVALLVYLALSLLTVLFFISGYAESIKILLTLQAVFLGVLAATLGVLAAAAKSAVEASGISYERANQLRQLEDRLAVILDRLPKAPWAVKLAKTHDALKFIDHSCSTSEDLLIAAKIEELEMLLNRADLPKERVDEEALSQVEQIDGLIASRSRSAGRDKRGSF